MTSVARLVLFAAAVSIGAAPLHAQCAPATLRLITDRKYVEARATVDAQLKRAPNDDAAMECLGRVLLEQGEADDAVDWLEKAIKINDKSAQHYLWLGKAASAQSEKATMLTAAFIAPRLKGAYERAVALDPTLMEARRALVSFYTQAPAAMGGGMDKAREQAAEILKLNPARGHMAYGLIAERENDYAGAVKEYQAAIATKSDSAINAHLSLGRVYVTKLKDYDHGEKEVKFWQANAPKDAPPVNISAAHYCMGIIHEQAGRLDKAKAEYQAAVTANPKNEDAKKALASLK